ncbi:hypothetical protein [Bradyrhizobium sp. WSM1743]|uniref:hypothetical protein n=1 Tax=Bradyrhizobium sp. WSM1743 TaxID=318996 RepID=UPI0012EC62D5|nr:hypothetical protein [Bradyrhizobium sp. WSM1743]
MTKEFYTRDELGAYLREAGYPIGKSTLDKLCSPSIAEGPPVAKYWGQRPLYTAEAGLAWAEARARKPDAQAA